MSSPMYVLSDKSCFLPSTMYHHGIMGMGQRSLRSKLRQRIPSAQGVLSYFALPLRLHYITLLKEGGLKLLKEVQLTKWRMGEKKIMNSDAVFSFGAKNRTPNRSRARAAFNFHQIVDEMSPHYLLNRRRANDTKHATVGFRHVDHQDPR